MPNSVMLQEVHAALNAGQYGKNPFDPNQPRLWNLGTMTHAIAVALGLNFNAKGEVMSRDKSVVYDDGDKVYNRYGSNQAGIAWSNKDSNKKEYKELVPFVGYLYDIITPKVTKNSFTGQSSDIDTGGMAGCPNIPALLEAFSRDLMKALGGDEAVSVVPSADGQGYGIYEGLASMLQENLFMSSHNSGLGMKNLINSQKGVYMMQELLRGQGLGIEPKEFTMAVNGQNVKAIYPGLSPSSPSQLDFILLLAIQLAHILPITMSAPLPPKNANKTPETEGI
jgi:hypothetical protein